MKKNLMILGGAIILLIILSAAFSSRSGSGTFVSDLSPDRGIKCTKIIAEGDAGSSEGVMYIYKDRVRYDSVMKHQQLGKRDMHVIVTKDKSYAWGSAFSVPGLIEGGLIFDNDSGEGPDLPELKDIEKMKRDGFEIPGMDCQPWNPDEEILTPPKDIKFSSQEDMMQNMMKGLVPGSMNFGNPVPMDNCNFCKNIPDEKQRQECQKSCRDEEDDGSE